MAARKDESKSDSNTTTAATRSTFDTSGNNPQQQFQAEERYHVNRSIDETKANVRRSIDEARREIPAYAQSLTDYHQQAMDSTQEITDNYLDSQREIINSTQQTWTNYLDTVYWWMSPRKLSEIYTRAVSNFADNSVSASKIWNETAMATMDASKAYLVRTKEASRDLSRINGNTARTIGRTSSQMRSGSSRSS